MVDEQDGHDDVEDEQLFKPDPATEPAMHVERCGRPLAHRCVLRWHYTRRLQCVTSDNYAVRERGRCVGVVVFGAGPAWAATYLGLDRRQACELARVALDRHATPTSRIVAVALRLLRRDRPAIRAVVSYADTAQGHHGGIYKAGGWLYTGSVCTHVYRVNGVDLHGRTLASRYGYGAQAVAWLRANLDPAAERVTQPPKHRYVYPLDDAMRIRLLPRVLPYPRREETTPS